MTICLALVSKARPMPLPPLVQRGAPFALQVEVQVRPESLPRTGTGTGFPDIDVGTRRRKEGIQDWSFGLQEGIGNVP